MDHPVEVKMIIPSNDNVIRVIYLDNKATLLK